MIVEQWYATPLADRALEAARKEMLLAEQFFNLASGPEEVTAAIHAWNEAEARFNERLRILRQCHIRYGAAAWGRSRRSFGRKRQNSRRAEWTGPIQAMQRRRLENAVAAQEPRPRRTGA